MLSLPIMSRLKKNLPRRKTRKKRNRQLINWTTCSLSHRRHCNIPLHLDPSRTLPHPFALYHLLFIVSIVYHCPLCLSLSHCSYLSLFVHCYIEPLVVDRFPQ